MEPFSGIGLPARHDDANPIYIACHIKSPASAVLNILDRRPKNY
jgi:hypothetical protein